MKDTISKEKNISDEDLEKLRVTLEQYGKYTSVAAYSTSLTGVSYCDTELPYSTRKKEPDDKGREKKRIVAAALLPFAGQRRGEF
jgi:hypothetical protein